MESIPCELKVPCNHNIFLQEEYLPQIGFQHISDVPNRF